MRVKPSSSRTRYALTNRSARELDQILGDVVDLNRAGTIRPPPAQVLRAPTGGSGAHLRVRSRRRLCLRAGGQRLRLRSRGNRVLDQLLADLGLGLLQAGRIALRRFVADRRQLGLGARRQGRCGVDAGLALRDGGLDGRVVREAGAARGSAAGAAGRAGARRRRAARRWKLRPASSWRSACCYCCCCRNRPAARCRRQRRRAGSSVSCSSILLRVEASVRAITAPRRCPQRH